jgi:hypothetical protein
MTILRFAHTLTSILIGSFNILSVLTVRYIGVPGSYCYVRYVSYNNIINVFHKGSTIWSTILQNSMVAGIDLTSPRRSAWFDFQGLV